MAKVDKTDVRIRRSAKLVQAEHEHGSSNWSDSCSSAERRQ